MGSSVYLVCLFFTISGATLMDFGHKQLPPTPVYVKPTLVPIPVYSVPEPAPVAVIPVASDGKMEKIIAGGTDMAKLITATLVAPWVFGASKVAAFADALPPLFAANGAFLGSMVAVPVQIGASATSGLVSGATGFLVGIPVGIGTGAVAAFHGAKEVVGSISLNHVKEKVAPVGHLLMKPIAIIGGGHTYILGKGINLIGEKLELLGNALGIAGQKVSWTGAGLEGKGSGMFHSALTKTHGSPVQVLPLAAGSGHNLMNKFPLLLAAVKSMMEGPKHGFGHGTRVTAPIPAPVPIVLPVAAPGHGLLSKFHSKGSLYGTGYSSGSGAAYASVSGGTAPMVPVSVYNSTSSSSVPVIVTPSTFNTTAT